MLELSDLRKIGEEVGKLIEENITPQFEDIRDDIEVIRHDVALIRSEMVTKSYLDDKLADIRGEFTTRSKPRLVT